MAVSRKAIEAGEASVGLGADDSQFQMVMDRAAERFKRFGSMLRNVGVGALKIGTGIVAGLSGVAYASLKYIDNIQDIADRTNSTTEAVSRLGYAAKLSASSLEDIEAANKKLNASAVAASQGSKEQAAAFAKMGISAENFLALDMDERFLLLAGAVEEMDSPLEKSSFLIALLGKQAATMLPLLESGATGLRDMFEEAEKTGSIIRSEDGKKAASAMDALDSVLTSVKATFIELGLAVFSFAGDVKEGQRVALMYLGMIRDWIKRNKQLVGIVLTVGAVLVGLGVTLVATGLAISAIGTAIGAVVAVAKAFAAVIAFIVTPLGVITLAIVALTAAVGYLIYRFLRFTELGQRITQSFIRGFKGMGEAFVVTWDGIIAYILKGDLETAGEIAMMGVYLVWKNFQKMVREVWHNVVNFFVEGFVSGISLIRAYFANLVSTIKTYALEMVTFVADKMIQVFGALEAIGIDELKGMKDVLEDFTKRTRGEIKLEKETAIKVEAGIFAEGDDFMRKWKEEQNKLIKADEKEIEGVKAIIKGLEQIAREPVVEPVKLPVAPMPRVKGAKLEDNLGMLGDSVRGLFDSADFQGALGLGGQNRYAKESRDLQRDMLTELRQIKDKIGPVEFG